MYSKNLIQINDVLVNHEILETKFACNLNKCKGACCTIESEYGAPLLPEELPLMEEAFSAAKEYLPKEHVEIIENHGFYEYVDGELVAKSFNNRACVFVYYENEVAKCSIESAYLEGKTPFRKPVSCHLFPIRISNFGGDILRYEKLDECMPALENGGNLNLTIVDICKDSLIRKYGNSWFNKLKEKSGS